MEIRQMHTFKVVAEQRSFTRAAELLGYAQSTITAQIQALEQEIGVPLFNRLGKRISLTEAGQRFLPHATEMLKLHDSALQSLQENEEVSGSLQIGAPESLAAYRLPEVLQHFRSLYPHVNITLKPGLCWEMRDALREGSLDIAITLDLVTESTDLTHKVLIEEPLVLTAPVGHRLSQHSSILPQDLQGETFLHTEPGCSYRMLFESSLQQYGVHTSSGLEFWNIEAIKHCVRCGLGIAYLPKVTIQQELDEGKLVALAWHEPLEPIATQYIYHKSKWRSPALSRFIEILEEHLPS